MRFSLFRAALLCGALAVPALPVLAPMPAIARPAPDGFADLAARLLPAVVNISSTQNVQATGNSGAGPDLPMFPPGSPFEQFFHDFMNRNRPNGGGQGQGGGGGGGGQGGPGQDQQSQGDDQAPVRRMQSLGSGFIVDPSGYIVTNNHVIEDADEITVTLQDNTSLKAKLVGKDERSDLALLKVESPTPLPAVSFGDSDSARVGNWVVAIGNPFGLGGSVTAGIVSARGRDIHQGPYDDFIQTDAAINRGNSGGPLFDMDGNVIGINTAIYSPSGGSIGIGFSIPANEAKNVIAQLRQFGRARRGWLGVRIQEVTPEIAESLGLHDDRGAMVAGVSDDGPAGKAKIRNGDVILKFNNEDVTSWHVLPRIVAETPIGQSVPVALWRDGKEQDLQVSVAELPDDQAQQAKAVVPAKPAAPQPAEISGLGLGLSPLTDDLRGKFQIGADQKGVVITKVAPNSAAADRGLRAGDVIVEVQQEAVTNPSDVQDRVDRVRKQNRRSVLMLVQGQDGLRWIPLPLAADNGDTQQPRKG